MGCIYTGSDLVPADEYLAHYGILRQKWGVRRFQNYDGTLTPAGRERYHKMIATNVQRDRMRTDGKRHKARSKVEKVIQKEFEATTEGKRLKKANDKLAKIQGRMNDRDDSYKDPENGVLAKTVNRIGQNADENRMAGALAEQNEAQKAAAKIYDELREKYKEELLDATIKDLKIYIVDDGREWLEKYIRGDDDATFSKVPLKQAFKEMMEAADDRRAGREKAWAMEDNGFKTDEEYEKWIGTDAYYDYYEMRNPENREDGHGVHGQSWPRKYQNSDGTLNEEGRKKIENDPKYVKKVEENGKVRYYYDKEALKAPLLRDRRG